MPPRITPQKRIKSIIKCIIQDMSDPFYQNVAPGLAYYFLLSIAPIIISISYFAGFFFINSSIITKAIDKYLPEQLATILIPFFSQQSATAGLITTVIFFIFTLYLASRGIYALIKVADYAADCYSAPTFKEVPRVFIKRHVKAIILTLFMILIIVFSLVFMVFGKAAIDIFISYSKINGLTKLLYWSYFYLAYPVAISVVFIILILFYSWMPEKRLKIKEVIPGSATAALGIIISSYAFMIYIKYFFSSNAIYGALSSIIMLILWFFLLSYVLVLGIIVNHAFKDTKPN